MSTMNLALAQKAATHAEKALNIVMDKLGVGVAVSNVTVRANGATMLVELLAIDAESGSVITTDEQEFRTLARYFRLEENDYGLIFQTQGHSYQIATLKRKNRKYPLICIRNGGRYKLPLAGDILLAIKDARARRDYLNQEALEQQEKETAREEFKDRAARIAGEASFS